MNLKPLLFFFGFLVILSILLFYRETKRVGPFPPTSWVEDQKADCAVVVTGGAYRVREGLNLLYQKQVRKLIISGVHPKATFREIFPMWPYYGELNEADIILERRSTTTYGNAQQSWPLIEALHCRDVVLVTSTLHMYRVYRTFRALLPKEMNIYPRAVVAGRLVPTRLDLGVEAFKSLFYSVWAY